MKILYDWKNLELVSVTSITNIITFVQFAFIPLEQAKNSTLDAKTEFTSVNVTGVVQALLAPFDFIDAFFKIAVPMRVLLSAVIIIGFFNLMVLSFFFPSWRLVIFLCDLLLPGMGMLGAMFIVQNYEAQKSLAYILAGIGFGYIVLRLIPFLVSLWRNRQDVNWAQRVARQLTSVFLSRLRNSKGKDHTDLNNTVETLKASILSHDIAIDFYTYPRLKRIIDIVIAAILLIGMIVIQYIITWKKIVSSQYTGIQLQDILDITDVVGNVFIAFFALRLLLAILYVLNKFKERLTWMRRKAFQGIVVLTGLVLLPVVNLVLQSTEVQQEACPYNEYYDFNVTNQTSFVSYFSNHPAGCTPCSMQAYSIYSCYQVCAKNYTYYVKYAAKAKYISETDLNSIYTLPITFLEIYFLFILTQLLSFLFKKSKDIIELLPAPTMDVEAKFSSIIQRLESTGGYVFSSYTHKSSLFYFDFQQVKTFILFLSSLMPIFPESPNDEGEYIIRDNSSLIIGVIFAISCAGIAFYNLFINPFRSKLHNSVNTISYGFGAITSIIAIVRVVSPDTQPIIGTIAYVGVIVVPIFFTIILPLFLRFDITKRPTEYKLKDINRKQNQIDQNRHKRKGRRNNDSSSESSSLNDIAQEDDDRDFTEPDWNTLKIAPTHIQMGIDYKKQRHYREDVEQVWRTMEVREGDLVDATNELFAVADILLDTTSYSYLNLILDISTIWVSLCAGWGIGAGVARWKTGNDYIQCNLYEYPEIIV